MFKKIKSWLLAAAQHNTLLAFALFPFAIVYIYVWQKPKIKRMQQAQSAELASWDSDDHMTGHDRPVKPGDTEDVCRLFNAKALPDLAPVYGKRLRRVLALRDTRQTYANTNDADTFWLVFEGKTSEEEYWVTTKYCFSKFEEFFYGGLIAFESAHGQTIKPRVPVGVTLLERPEWQAFIGLPLKKFSRKNRYDPPRPDIIVELGVETESVKVAQLCFDWLDTERKKPFAASQWDEWMAIDLRGIATHFALRGDVQEALERPSSLDSDEAHTKWHEPAHMQALAELQTQLQRFTLWFETKAMWHSMPVSEGKPAHPDDWLAHRCTLWTALDALAAWRILLLHGERLSASHGGWLGSDGLDYGEAWVRGEAPQDWERDKLTATLQSCALPLLFTESWWDRDEFLQIAPDADHPNHKYRPAWINADTLSHPTAKDSWAQRVWTRYGAVREAFRAWDALNAGLSAGLEISADLQKASGSEDAEVQNDESDFAAYLATILGREGVQGDGYPTKDQRQVQINWPPYAHTQSAQLPPYSASDLAHLDEQWDHANRLGIAPDIQTCPRWVIGKDDGSGVWLLGVGLDIRKEIGEKMNAAVTCIPRLYFPSNWPATHNGRGKISCMTGGVDWREYNRIGAEARPSNWHLRVVGYDLQTQNMGLWGMVDLEGRFVLPCQFAEMSAAHGLLGAKEDKHTPPLPAGRLQFWQWSAVRKPSDPSVDALGRKVVDVIEVWSGRRVNPEGLKVLAGTLHWGYFVVCRDDAANMGLMRATEAEPGEMRWSQVYNQYTPDPGVAACCATTGLWGYIGALGQVVVEPQFLEASSFSARLAYVRTAQGLMGAIAFDLTRNELRSLPLEATNLSIRWVLAPKWPQVVDEYDGHFTVQDESGNWGMVNPRGEAVTPFDVTTEFLSHYFKWDEPNDWSSSRDEHIRHSDAHNFCREQFKSVQQTRVFKCLKEIASGAENSKQSSKCNMGQMAGLLFSSYGAYDYGSLSHSNWVLRLERDVQVSTIQYGGAQGGDGRDREVEQLLPAGMMLTWDPSQRIYAGFADLSTHAVVSKLDKKDYSLRIEWEALSLVVPQPARILEGEVMPEHTERQASEIAEGLRLLEKWRNPKAVISAATLETALIELAKDLERHLHLQTKDAWDIHQAARTTSRLARAMGRLQLAVALQDAQGVVWHSSSFRLDLHEADAASAKLSPDAEQTASELFELWQLVMAACAEFSKLIEDDNERNNGVHRTIIL